MNNTRRFWLKQTLMLALTAVMGTSAYAQNKEVVIGYQDMVVPWRYAQQTRLLEARTGYKVTYRQIGSGADVVRALASGAIDIGEAGSSPFAAGLSQGVPIELFWVLDNINEAEALVARKDAGVASVADLKGKKIALPFASTTHFHLLVALENSGVKANEVQILNLRPPEVLAAWQRNDIDATFIWNPVLQQVKENGTVLLTSGQIAKETGKATFDAIAVRKKFAKENDDFLTQFVKVLAEADKDYVDNTTKWSADSDQAKAVAKWSGAQVKNVPDSLALYSFVPPAEQAAKQWLGGGKDSIVVQSLAATSEFLKKQGTIGNTLSDYSIGVNSRWVERVAQGQ